MVKMWCGLLVVAVLAVAGGCSDDEETGPGGTAGKSGSGGSDGGAGSSGTGGASGGSGSAGSSGAGGGAGSDAGPPPGLLLVAGTDFTTGTEVAAIDLATGTITANVTVTDGDAVPIASGGRGFVLERTNDVIHLLTATGSIDKSIAVGRDDGGPPANPTGIAVTGATSAFVTLYGENRIAVLDLAQGTVAKSVDLSAYLQSGDGDGAVDVATPIYDASSGRVYVTLARIDRTTVAPPDFQLACPSVPALVVAIDAASGTIVDLNGSAAGEAATLLLKNPIDVAFDAANSRLLVLAAGCFAPVDAGSARTGHGVEAFELASAASSVLFTPTDASFLSRLLHVGGDEALINRFDESFGEHWNRWTMTQSALGAELTGVPLAPSYDGTGALLGAEITSSDAGSTVSVVRYDLANAGKSTIAQDPWQGSFTASSGSALVRP